MKIGTRTARLVREAAIAGYVNGSRFAQYRSPTEVDADFPQDSLIVAGVLKTARAHGDLYRTLAKVESIDAASDAVLANVEADGLAMLRSMIAGDTP